MSAMNNSKFNPNISDSRESIITVYPILYSTFYVLILLMGFLTTGPEIIWITYRIRNLLSQDIVYGLICMGVSDLTALFLGASRFLLIYLFNFDIRCQADIFCKSHVFLTYWASDFSILLKVYLSIFQVKALSVEVRARNFLNRGRMSCPQIGILLCFSIILIKSFSEAAFMEIRQFEKDGNLCFIYNNIASRIISFMDGGFLLFVYPLLLIFNIIFIIKMNNIKRIHSRLIMSKKTTHLSRDILNSENPVEIWNNYSTPPQNVRQRPAFEKDGHSNARCLKQIYHVLFSIVATNFLYLICFLPYFLSTMIIEFGFLVNSTTPSDVINQIWALHQMPIACVYLYHSVNISSYVLSYRRLRTKFFEEFGKFCCRLEQQQ